MKEEVLQTTGGAYCFDPGGSEQYLLKRKYTDSMGKTQDALIYDLIFATADFALPILNKSVMQDFTTNQLPDVTVTSDEKNNMQKANTFYQQVQVYPNSQMVKNYQAALTAAEGDARSTASSTGGDIQKTEDSIDQRVAAFFATTKNFQGLTLSDVVAIQNYYASFPFGWASFKSKQYWLYSSDGSTSSFVGRITMTPPSTVDLSKPNGGYSIYLQTAKNPTDTSTVDVNDKQIALTYVDSMFVDDPNTDVPKIGLKGIFRLKSQVTGAMDTDDPTDDVIMSFLTGTVYGATCLGLDGAHTTENPDEQQSDRFWNTLFHPKTSQQVFQSIMEIGGALMMLHFAVTSLVGAKKWLKEKFAQGKSKGEANPKDSDLESNLSKELDDLKAEQNALMDELFKRLETKDIPDPPKDLDAAASEVATQTDILSANVQAGNMECSIDSVAIQMGDALEDLGTEISAKTMENLEYSATELKGVSDKINNDLDDAASRKITPEELASDMSSINSGDFKSATSGAEAVSKELNTEIASKQTRALEEATENASAVQEEADNVEKANEQAEEEASGENMSDDGEGLPFGDAA
ncbi:hypothetical protein [Ruegeria atlantica]|uniref:hypothetical protein n=1 Tax=Ruegeria atlantica TaxID=81569 RepID=UPI00147BD97A|nr:hypothetical protein [Ruegeria atlantica]